MIRSAISSSTRCRDELPPAWAGSRSRRLAGAAADLLLVLVLALGVLVLRLLVVMRRVFSFKVGVRLFWAGLGRPGWMRGAWRFHGGLAHLRGGCGLLWALGRRGCLRGMLWWKLWWGFCPTAA